MKESLGKWSLFWWICEQVIRSSYLSKKILRKYRRGIKCQRKSLNYRNVKCIPLVGFYVFQFYCLLLRWCPSLCISSIKAVSVFIWLTLFKGFIYLFLDRGEGREKEKERNINLWLPLTYPLLGTRPQPRPVPWLGIKPVTLWLTGQGSIHWTTPARAE